MDIYTYVVRGKVFANAQTGNIVLFGLNIAEGNVKESFYYLIPILAFMLGVFIAEKIRKYFTNNKTKIHWRQVIIIIEMITILIVSFIPRGRFNMFDVNGINVILDYGHNIDGYKVVIDSLKNLGLKNITGIIGVPGDRDLNTMKEVGRISGDFFDSIVIKEDKDLRGKDKGEVASIINEGVLSSNRKDLNVKIILSEEEALRETLKLAKKGETIIMFFEDYESLYDIINEFKNKGTKDLKSASI